MTEKKPKPIKVGACRFRDPAVAAKVEANHAAFAATVNREGMTADERRTAFAAFFAKRA